MIEQTIRLYCDSCDDNWLVSNESVPHARNSAQVNGWERHATDGGTLDICPTCAQYIKEVRAQS